MLEAFGMTKCLFVRGPQHLTRLLWMTVPVFKCVKFKTFFMVFFKMAYCTNKATLYKMAQRVLAENASVQSVSYSLPNKHYIPVDMRYIGLENLKPCVSP